VVVREALALHQVLSGSAQVQWYHPGEGLDHRPMRHT
jgi:hypothetical protein